MFLQASHPENAASLTDRSHNITKEKLIEIMKSFLSADADLDFLMQLKKKELETLVACIRDKVGLDGK